MWCTRSCLFLNVAVVIIILLVDYADNRVLEANPLGKNSTKLKCESLDYLKCGQNHPNNVPCVPEILECEAPEQGKRAHCFALWKRENETSENFVELKKGCWLDSKECYDRKKCVANGRHAKGELNFCCCEGDLCNSQVSYDLTEEAEPDDSVHNYPYGLASSVVGESEDAGGYQGQFFAYAAAPFVVAVFALPLALWIYRRKKSQPYFDPMPVETALPPYPSTLKPQIQAAMASNGPFRSGPVFDAPNDENPRDPNSNDSSNNTQFLELKARGRFGAVWRAQCGSRIVAVKTFSIQEKDSWECELEVYGLPGIKHQNVLEFLGAEIRGEGLQREFWILSVYHPEGSLCDYLRSHTVTLEELKKIVRGFTAGLNHLHDDLYAIHGSSPVSGCKPPVAHRDFKSKNVLVKSDLSVCVADFGLALVFYPNRQIGDVHGQVGTKRYMAPEVLEGAINFTRDCFLRIDMYACGLVMWEVLTRCTECYDGQVPDYRMPFEAEVGLHPTLEEMQEAVVGRGLRPVIPSGAWNHPELALFSATMEDCWDADIEARLSASCVGERLAEMTAKNGPSSYVTVSDQHRHQSPSLIVGGGGNAIVSAGGANNPPNAMVLPGPNGVQRSCDGLPSAGNKRAMMMMGVDRMSVSGDSAATASLLLSSPENSGSTATAHNLHSHHHHHHHPSHVIGHHGVGAAVGGGVMTTVTTAVPNARAGMPHLNGSSGPPPYSPRDE